MRRARHDCLFVCVYGNTWHCEGVCSLAFIQLIETSFTFSLRPKQYFAPWRSLEGGLHEKVHQVNIVGFIPQIWRHFYVLIATTPMEWRGPFEMSELIEFLLHLLKSLRSTKDITSCLSFGRRTGEDLVYAREHDRNGPCAALAGLRLIPSVQKCRLRTRYTNISSDASGFRLCKGLLRTKSPRGRRR